MPKKAKDVPIIEITLRKYEKPGKIKGRELVRLISLSLGLISPGDSRDIIVDILHLLVQKKKGLPVGKLETELIKKRKRAKLAELGVTPSNIHRQLRRLKALGIIEKHLEVYRLSEGMSLSEIIEKKLVPYHIDSILARLQEYTNLIGKKQ